MEHKQLLCRCVRQRLGCITRCHMASQECAADTRVQPSAHDRYACGIAYSRGRHAVRWRSRDPPFWRPNDAAPAPVLCRASAAPDAAPDYLPVLASLYLSAHMYTPCAASTLQASLVCTLHHRSAWRSPEQVRNAAHILFHVNQKHALLHHANECLVSTCSLFQKCESPKSSPAETRGDRLMGRLTSRCIALHTYAYAARAH